MGQIYRLANNAVASDKDSESRALEPHVKFGWSAEQRGAEHSQSNARTGHKPKKHVHLLCGMDAAASCSFSLTRISRIPLQKHRGIRAGARTHVRQRLCDLGHALNTPVTSTMSINIPSSDRL